MGGLLAAVPAFAIADPIDDKQAEAAQLEQQINGDGEKLGALNEQINASETQIDEAEAGRSPSRRPGSRPRRAKSLAAPTWSRARRRRLPQEPAATASAELERRHAAEQASRSKYAARRAARQADREPARAGEGQTRRAAGRRREGARRRADAAGRTKSRASRLRRRSRPSSTKVKGGIDGARAQRVGAAGAGQAPRRRSRGSCAAPARRAAAAGSSAPAVDTPRIPPASGGAGAVVAYAYAQLGKPYCYAGVGPELLRLLGPHDDGVGPGRASACRTARPSSTACSRACR